MQKWELIDHICANCLCRIVSAPSEDGRTLYRCTGCGKKAEGESPSVLCACGMKTKFGSDLAIRCVLNLGSVPCPFEVVAKTVDLGP